MSTQMQAPVKATATPMQAVTPVRPGILQRKCACGGTPGPDGECAQCRTKRLALQRKALSPAEPSIVPPVVHEALHSPGQPLDAATRAYMEPRFGHDFSKVRVSPQAQLAINQPGDRYEQEAERIAAHIGHSSPIDYKNPAPVVDFSHVRVHTDERAAEAARAINARAFTVGQNIMFAAGQYAPSSMNGRSLLAHELTHVVQQQTSSRPASTVQRAITVQNPAGPTPNPPAGVAVTNAAIVESWIDQLCPTGNWTVDGATGAVSSPDRANFCGPRAVKDQPHFRSSGAPTSCGCLCELTAPGATNVRVHAANAFTVGRAVVSVTGGGEGVTAHPAAAGGEFNVGISGLDPAAIIGAGDTSPHAGANPTQTLRDPPWIIFGHEVCGHVRLAATRNPSRVHSQTPEGDRETVDIENRIRREHSTIADNLGIRRGVFNDAAGAQHDGSVFRVSAGETLSGIAQRCGLTRAEILTRIFRENGDAVTAATQNTLRTNERLMIEGIFWHEVISGETMTTIATMWVIPLSSLIRANPQISNPEQIRPGQRLLVPAR